MKWLVAGLVIGASTFFRAAVAAPVPQWALGTWVATSTVESAERHDLGGSFVAKLTDELARTQLEVTPGFVQVSASLYGSDPSLGVGIHTRISKVPLATVLEGIARPYVYGEPITYHPALSVTMAAVSLMSALNTASSSSRRP